MRDPQQVTYINIITDTLRRKLEVLGALEEATSRQEEIAGQEQPDMEMFETLIEAKDKLLERLNGLDDGFMELYTRVAETLKKNTEDYAEEISQIQELIRGITDKSTSLQAAEERNRQKLAVVFSEGKKKVKDFKISSRTAAAYYKNMSGHHQDGDSYFFNKKK